MSAAKSGMSPARGAAKSGIYLRFFNRLSLLTVTAVTVVGLLVFAWLFRFVVQSATEAERTKVARLAERIEREVSNVSVQVRLAAANTSIADPQWQDALDEELQRVMRALPAVVRIDVYGKSGDRQFSSIRGYPHPVKAAPELGYVPQRGGSASETRAELGTQVLTLHGAPVVPVELCLVENCAVAVVALMVAGTLQDLVNADESAGAIVSILDSRNRVVAHPNRVLAITTPDLSAEAPIASLRAKLPRQSEPASIHAWVGGHGYRIFAAARIGQSEWLAVRDAAGAPLLAPIGSLGLLALAGLAVAVAGAVLGSRSVARSLVRPIEELELLTRGVGGTPRTQSQTAQLKTGDEIEFLADRVEAMASELQSYTTSLEQKVAEKTAQLAAANQHKSEFLANMSHELRTPLNAVIGFSDALKEQYFGELNAKQMEYANDISASGQHLLSLINDILDLSKIEAGKMELELSRFSLDDAVRNALTLVRERAQKNFITLKSDLAEGLGDVVADERKVKQILINLVTNAVKFSYPNGLVLVSAWRDKNALCVAVKDTGAGIAPEDHATIFEEFRQVASGGSAKHEGTGLGLSLARRMAELHGGTLTVASTRGHGATFTFSFPADLVAVPLQV